MLFGVIGIFFCYPVSLVLLRIGNFRVSLGLLGFRTYPLPFSGFARIKWLVGIDVEDTELLLHEAMILKPPYLIERKPPTHRHARQLTNKSTRKSRKK